MCAGVAYALEGNPKNIGHDGAPGLIVSPGSAAIVPRQWGGETKMGPALRQIGMDTFGTITSADGTTESFDTITQPIGNAKLGSALHAQDVIMGRAPGALVIEIVGGSDFGYNPLSTIVLSMPALGESAARGRSFACQ